MTCEDCRLQEQAIKLLVIPYVKSIVEKSFEVREDLGVKIRDERGAYTFFFLTKLVRVYRTKLLLNKRRLSSSHILILEIHGSYYNT